MAAKTGPGSTYEERYAVTLYLSLHRVGVRFGATSHFPQLSPITSPAPSRKVGDEIKEAKYPTGQRSKSE